MARMNESQRCCTKVGRWIANQRIASFPRTLLRDREGHMYDYTYPALAEASRLAKACIPRTLWMRKIQNRSQVRP